MFDFAMAVEQNRNSYKLPILSADGDLTKPASVFADSVDAVAVRRHFDQSFDLQVHQGIQRVVLHDNGVDGAFADAAHLLHPEEGDGGEPGGL
ncbi:hypothetical protein [Stenotrophomonas maltophilia]|uniref:hypothetical protein n=1 Tax=Stenotrophomonas maltophilia TaxID=40324 RepID=UPI0028947477|nr:hypothetical protein [Stenotrophomonas maltophilia]MDT3487486.1 hypothetical protein [Stenotrophomonas maltophilia]